MRTSQTDDRMIEELYPRLYRFAAVVAPRGDDPDDLVQDALVRTLGRRPLADIELGLTPGAARQRASRGRAEIRDRLENEPMDPPDALGGAAR